MRHEKTVSEGRFGPLWEPWEVDEIGRKNITYISSILYIVSGFLQALVTGMTANAFPSFSHKNQKLKKN